MTRVVGKVAIITGGAGGIGRAIGLRLGQNGARVLLTDRDVEAVRNIADTLAASGLEVDFCSHDVSDEDSWSEVIARAKARFERIDIVVNNAGTGPKEPVAFEDIPLREWQRILRVNLDGAFLGTQAAVKAMKMTGGGSIINIGSIAGYVGTPGGAAYGTSKGALRTLTKHAATHCARLGLKIRVNCIHPCYVWTPFVSARAEAQFGQENARSALAALHPFGQLGEPDDLAWAAVYLASEESRLMTGADLVIDGGALSV